MSQKVKLEIPAERLNAYMAALDMGIALCMDKITHINAADYLAELRAEMMETYLDQVHNDAD